MDGWDCRRGPAQTSSLLSVDGAQPAVRGRDLTGSFEIESENGLQGGREAVARKLASIDFYPARREHFLQQQIDSDVLAAANTRGGGIPLRWSGRGQITLLRRICAGRVLGIVVAAREKGEDRVAPLSDFDVFVPGMVCPYGFLAAISCRLISTSVIPSRASLPYCVCLGRNHQRALCL